MALSAVDSLVAFGVVGMTWFQIPGTGDAFQAKKKLSRPKTNYLSAREKVISRFECTMVVYSYVDAKTGKTRPVPRRASEKSRRFKREEREGWSNVVAPCLVKNTGDPFARLTDRIASSHNSILRIYIY